MSFTLSVKRAMLKDMRQFASGIPELEFSMIRRPNPGNGLYVTRAYGLHWVTETRSATIAAVDGHHHFTRYVGPKNCPLHIELIARYLHDKYPH